MKQIPIEYVVKAQRLHTRIFELEDNEYMTIDESREHGACCRAYNDYLDKMFLDDTKTIRELDRMFNQLLCRSGTYKEICDFVRSKGYEVLSADNSTKEEHELCKKECLNAWKAWRIKK